MAPELLDREDYGCAVDLFALGVIMFSLLGGYEPFHPASNVRAPLEFDSACWGHLSEKCVVFVSSLLRTVPDQRLSTSQAAEDDWFLATTVMPVSVADLPRGAPKPRELS